MQHFLELKNISKTFGHSTVIEPLDLSIKRGEMVTLLGPSGCGKTTILRLIAGLETPSSGQIWLDGEDVTHASISARDVCIVFQTYALFPHMTIGENVGYGLKTQGVPSAERRERVKEALELVDLAGFENRLVDQISGGQQQRVALARALILKPKVLLFDEPLSNLDANLRRSMREKIRELQQRLGITSLYVTHDQTEAFAVSDQVIVMQQGKIKQKASARELYQRPNSLFLANFMGESAVFPATLAGETLTANGYTFTLPNAAQFGLPDGDCLLGVRPEAVNLQPTGAPCQRCTIERAVYMGSHWEITASWAGKPLLINANPAHFHEQCREAFVQFHPEGLFLLKVE